jgi:hypothetical protein
MKNALLLLTVLAVLLSSSRTTGFAQQDTPVKEMKLKVSPNKRYLVNQDGKPFFYLGDTAWTLLKDAQKNLPVELSK